MCMLTQEWILEQHGLDGEKHKMRIKYLFYKIVRKRFAPLVGKTVMQNLFLKYFRQLLQMVFIVIIILKIFHFIILLQMPM